MGQTNTFHQNHPLSSHFALRSNLTPQADSITSNTKLNHSHTSHYPLKSCRGIHMGLKPAFTQNHYLGFLLPIIYMIIKITIFKSSKPLAKPQLHNFCGSTRHPRTTPVTRAPTKIRGLTTTNRRITKH